MWIELALDEPASHRGKYDERIEPVNNENVWLYPFEITKNRLKSVEEQSPYRKVRTE